ncbi:cadherin-like beta sandwich domain-containing protein [Flavobacterium sp. N1736]|uniref:cadherin-like beta sandwich domain-containing protein n=1 Tax=Flavobacterium sp. N1736 TaxID=2986823 RepID=UPI002224693D|nr:cadherin-like beta sandwich domain-containing protein [Flavobacterium sp. N1736]
MNKNLLIVLAFLLFNIGYGQTLKTWTGATSSAWEEGSNWDTGNVPTPLDDVLITNADNQPEISELGTSCAALMLTNSTSGSVVVLTVKTGSFSTASITMNNTGGDATSDCSLKIEGGTVSVTGNIVMTGTALQNDVTFTGLGNLTIGGIMNGGTLNAIGMGTVTYNGTGTRNVGTYTYHNLTLSGSGVRTITPGVLVNATFTMAGAAKASAAPTYGNNAALKYSAVSTTAGPEWITPFAAKGGIEIIQGSTVALNSPTAAEKRFNDGVPFIINEEASLAVTNTELYFGGNFINNWGSLTTDKFVYLTGGVNQTIASFTSTEGIAMIKSAGIATFIGKIETKQLTINGLGTLNLGSGLTHTFSSDWTRTQGTLNAGSSILKIAGNVVGTGGSFNAGTSTVEFNGAAQNLGTGSLIYNNLKLSGTGIKTFGATTTISETFSISSGVFADLTANLVHKAKYIKLGDAAQAGGSWGSKNSNAVNKNDSYFILNNGIVNVGPTIVVNTNSIAAMTSVYGTPSAPKTFTISGTDIVGGILVTTPAGFEVSTDGTNFSNTITIGPAGYIANTIAYVRLKGTIDAKNYSGDIVLTSTGTTPITIPIPTSTVDKAPLKITTENKNIKYGDEIPVLTATYDKFVNNDTTASLGTSFKIETTAVKGSAAKQYNITFSGANSLNYDITYGQKGILTIDKAVLTITTNSDSRAYGSDNPVFTANYVGFKNGDAVASLGPLFKIETEATKQSPVEKYKIIASGADSPNYTFDYKQTGILDVFAKELIITADRVEKTHGEKNPILTVKYSGFIDGDNEESLTFTKPVITTTAVTESIIGNYPITVSGAASKNYEITFVAGILEVLPSSDANLSDIIVNKEDIVPAFDPAKKGYTIEVPNSTDSIVINPIPHSPYATVVMTIEGVTIDPLNPLDLKVGDNVIKIEVTAEDGITQETYEIIVKREEAPLSNNSGLTDLAISEGKLEPGFTEGNTAYTATVPYNVENITATPVTADSTAKVTIDGVEVPSGTASADLPLKVGENTITTVVTAQDGTITTYTVVVTREAAPLSNNSGLTDLAISEGKLEPGFTEGNIAYTATVPYNVENITATPVTADSTAKVTIDGVEVPSGTASADLPLKVGENTITTVVTAQDGTITTYTVVVTREAAPLSNNSGLTDLAISEGTLSPVFEEGVTKYDTTVPNDVTTIKVTPTTADTTATVTVNGKEVPSGKSSGEIDLQVGKNEITTVVTAQDGTTTTYTVIVTREPSGNAGLADIALSDGDLSPAFNTDTKDYRVDVPNETNSIVITPTPIDPTAKVEMIVDGVTVDPTAPIDLKVGDNIITVVVTAEDGTKETYTVIVNRADEGPQAIVPTNVITPNGDGKNDYWIIDGLDKYPNNSVKVFDRAARLVYSKNNYNNDWDGTFKGSPVNEDTYYYLIDLGNGSPKMKGFISIIRN